MSKQTCCKSGYNHKNVTNIRHSKIQKYSCNDWLIPFQCWKSPALSMITSIKNFSGKFGGNLLGLKGIRNLICIVAALSCKILNTQPFWHQAFIKDLKS